MTRLEKFKTVCQKYLVIEDTDYIDVVFGTIFANRLDSKPVWLYLIGPPGSGKTEILQALFQSPEVYALSKLTINTLVSGQGSADKDASLIPHLDGKNLVLKDFSALLTKPRDEFMEIMGQLRDAYDGTVRNRYGTGKDVFYKSKFGCIAAVTGAIDKHKHALAPLGERFVTYRIPEISDIEKRKRCRVTAKVKSTKEQERELAQAGRFVLAANPQVATLPPKYLDELVIITCFVARARTSISWNKFFREPEIPEPEIGTRLTKQLADLACGIAMVREKKAVTKNEMLIIYKMALHSIEKKRLILLNILANLYPDYTTFETIKKKITFSNETVHRWLIELELLDLIEKRKILTSSNTEKHQFRLKVGQFLCGLLRKYLY